MPRGRPRKVVSNVAVSEPDIEPGNGNKKLVLEIADIVHAYCMVPGCSAKFHTEEAIKILNLVNSHL